MNEAQPELDRGSGKYLVIMDIPYSEGYYYYTPPGAGEAQTVAENLYGMQYFNHLVYSIRAHRLGGVVIPVVLLSKPSTLPAESLVISKERFPGAADILVSPLSSESMAAKLQTLPEKALAAAVEAGAKRFATLMQGPVSRLMMDNATRTSLESSIRHRMYSIEMCFPANANQAEVTCPLLHLGAKQSQMLLAPGVSLHTASLTMSCYTVHS